MKRQFLILGVMVILLTLTSAKCWNDGDPITIPATSCPAPDDIWMSSMGNTAVANEFQVTYTWNEVQQADSYDLEITVLSGAASDTTIISNTIIEGITDTFHSSVVNIPLHRAVEAKVSSNCGNTSSVPTPSKRTYNKNGGATVDPVPSKCNIEYLAIAKDYQCRFVKFEDNVSNCTNTSVIQISSHLHQFYYKASELRTELLNTQRYPQHCDGIDDINNILRNLTKYHKYGEFDICSHKGDTCHQ